MGLLFFQFLTFLKKLQFSGFSFVKTPVNPQISAFIWFLVVELNKLQSSQHGAIFLAQNRWISTNYPLELTKAYWLGIVTGNLGTFGSTQKCLFFLIYSSILLKRYEVAQFFELGKFWTNYFKSVALFVNEPFFCL